MANGMNDPLDPLTQQIIGAAIDVSRGLGRGLLESAYEACLAHELIARGIPFERQKPLPVAYKGAAIDCAYRMDFVVGDQVIVEVKAVEDLTAVHDAQMLTYLRLYKRRVGLLFNFNVKVLSRDGLKRFVNGFLCE
jgi:GxxExxY protein